MRCGACCRLSAITVLPHEVLVLRRIAKEKGVKVNFKEGYMVYDEVSGTNIVLSYHMLLDNGKCPFLNNGSCLVHFEYKPLTCRSFPYVPKEILYMINEDAKIIFHKSKYGLSTACEFVKKYSRKIEELLGNHSIAEIMPVEYKHALEAEQWRRWYMRMLTLLWNTGLVNLSSKPNPTSRNVNAYEFIVARLVLLRILTSRKRWSRDDEI